LADLFFIYFDNRTQGTHYIAAHCKKKKKKKSLCAVRRHVQRDESAPKKKHCKRGIQPEIHYQ